MPSSRSCRSSCRLSLVRANAWDMRTVGRGCALVVAEEPKDDTARLSSEPDRLPSRCDRCCRRRARPFAARLAATGTAPPPRRRSDAARRHPRPPLRGRLGHRRGPAPRRGARTARSRGDRGARCFFSRPRAPLSSPAARRAQALPESSPPWLAPERRSSGADPAPPRGFPHRPPSSSPLACCLSQFRQRRSSANARQLRASRLFQRVGGRLRLSFDACLQRRRPQVRLAYSPNSPKSTATHDWSPTTHAS